MEFQSKLIAVFVLASLAIATQNCQNAGKSSPGVSQHEAAQSATGTSAPPQSTGEKAKSDAQHKPEEYFQTAAAAVGKIDSLKKFIRTADLRFRVADVLKSTLEIERITVKSGGFVTQSNLSTRQRGREVENLNRDSSLETMTIEPECQLILRIPFHMFDTTLREIGRQCELMDFRNVKAEDIGLQILENQLIALRQKIYEQQVSGMAKSAGVRSESRLQAAEQSLQSRAATDQSRLDNLKIEDQIWFSTVKISIYQLPLIRQQVIANVQNHVERPSFGRRFLDSVGTGWQILETLVLGIFSIWPLVLLFGSVWFFVLKNKRKKPA